MIKTWYIMDKVVSASQAFKSIILGDAHQFALTDTGMIRVINVFIAMLTLIHTKN